MWELDRKWGWAPNWCFWTVVVENNVENPLYSKEIKPVNPKENQHCIFIGRTDAEASNTSATCFEDLAHWKKKTLLLGKIEGRRRRRWQRMRWLYGIINSVDISLSKSGRLWRTGKPSMLQSMGSQRMKRLSDWTTTTTRWGSWEGYFWSKGRTHARLPKFERTWYFQGGWARETWVVMEMMVGVPMDHVKESGVYP